MKRSLRTTLWFLAAGIAACAGIQGVTVVLRPATLELGEAARIATEEGLAVGAGSTAEECVEAGLDRVRACPPEALFCPPPAGAFTHACVLSSEDKSWCETQPHRARGSVERVTVVGQARAACQLSVTGPG